MSTAAWSRLTHELSGLMTANTSERCMMPDECPKIQTLLDKATYPECMVQMSGPQFSMNEDFSANNLYDT